MKKKQILLRSIQNLAGNLSMTDGVVINLDSNLTVVGLDSCGVELLNKKENEIVEFEYEDLEIPVLESIFEWLDEN